MLPRLGRFWAIELVVALTVIAVVSGVIARRMSPVSVQVEAVAMHQVIEGIRSAVALEVATAVARGERAELAQLAGMNPMALLAEPPANYVGEFGAESAAGIAGGTWYFFRPQAVLVYRVRNSHAFETALHGAPRARFKLDFGHADTGDSEVSESTADEVRSLELRSLEPFRWTPLAVDE
jgi:general secretion pathway protein G